jgi:sodium/bile acid cotransporter 7
MLARIKPDGFTMLLLATVLVASILPCRGTAATVFEWATKVAITLLFFMHGAKLSRKAMMRGIGAWRLHLMVTASTFVLFPLLGLLIVALPDRLVDADIKAGLLFLSILPSTVQSSIAFTSIAGGNVAAAVCSASLSNILGVFLTPLLAGLLIHSTGNGHADTLSAIQSVAAQHEGQQQGHRH